MALARALVNRPGVLLLDEPLAALDLKLRKAMQVELKRMQREIGITFVFVTHDQEEALTMSDRIAVMSDGRVEQIGTPAEIYDSPSRVRGRLHRFGQPAPRRGHRPGRRRHRRRAAQRPDDPARAGDAHPVGALVSVMLRPERLHVAIHAASGARSITGTVRDLVFQGATARLDCTLVDGSHVVATVPGGVDLPFLRPGDTAYLTWESGSAYLLAGWPQHPGATSTDLDALDLHGDG